MAPKKAAPASKDKEEAPAATKTKAPKDPKPTKLKTLGNPSTLAMVVEALKHSERKGTSVQAIRTRILAAHPTVDPMRLKFLLRTALNKGIEKGILVRPPNSSATGATGRFKLAKPIPKAKEGGSSTESENVDPNAEPKEKPKKKAVKKAKSTELKGEKPEKEAAAKEEKPAEEKPKASKPKKDAEEKPKVAAAKKPKDKKVDGDAKTKKEPAKKEDKAENAEKGTTKALKDSEEIVTAKTSKKGKK